MSDLAVVGTTEVGETVEGFAVDGTGVLGSGVGATVVGGIELGVGVDGAAVHTAVLQAIVSAVAGHGSPVPSDGNSIARSRLELPPPPEARLRSERANEGRAEVGRRVHGSEHALQLVHAASERGPFHAVYSETDRIRRTGT